MDWTSNPLVALFFAIEDSQITKDGVVWCVRRNKTNELLPNKFKEMIEAQHRYQLLYVYNLRRRFRSLQQFDKESKDALVWIEAPSVNPRIVNQYAFFSVMPGIDTSTSDWLANYPDVYWGVAVPSTLKYEIKWRLDRMNITHRTMFPGLEGVARWLNESYQQPFVKR